MKLEKAIEILEREQEDTFMGSEKEWKGAVKLGIEAQKAWAEMRQGKPHPELWLLPGETEE